MRDKLFEDNHSSSKYLEFSDIVLLQFAARYHLQLNMKVGVTAAVYRDRIQPISNYHICILFLLCSSDATLPSGFRVCNAVHLEA